MTEVQSTASQATVTETPKLPEAADSETQTQLTLNTPKKQSAPLPLAGFSLGPFKVRFTAPTVTHSFSTPLNASHTTLSLLKPTSEKNSASVSLPRLAVDFCGKRDDTKMNTLHTLAPKLPAFHFTALISKKSEQIANDIPATNTANQKRDVESVSESVVEADKDQGPASKRPKLTHENALDINNEIPATSSESLPSKSELTSARASDQSDVGTGGKSAPSPAIASTEDDFSEVDADVQVLQDHFREQSTQFSQRLEEMTNSLQDAKESLHELAVNLVLLNNEILLLNDPILQAESEPSRSLVCSEKQ